MVRLAKNGDLGGRRALAEYAIEVLARHPVVLHPTVPTIDDSGDLMQNALLRIIRGIESFEYKDEPDFRAWVVRIATNARNDRIDYHRAARRDIRRTITIVTSDEFNHGIPDHLSDPSAVNQKRELVDVVQSIIKELPAREQVTAKLSLIENHSLAVIQARLNISSSEAQRLLAKAKARIATKIGARYREQRPTPKLT